MMINRMVLNRIIGVLLLSMIFAACIGPKAGVAPESVTPGTIDEANARWAGTSASDLEAGRAVMAERCSRCHAFPNVVREDEQEWPGIMEKMAKKAKLDSLQKEQVTHFIIAWRADMIARGTNNEAE